MLPSEGEGEDGGSTKRDGEGGQWRDETDKRRKETKWRRKDGLMHMKQSIGEV